MLNDAKILELMKQVQDPSLKKSLVELNAIKDLKIKENNVSIKIALYQPGQDQLAVQNQVVSLIKGAGAESVGFRFAEYTPEEKEQVAHLLQAAVPNLLSPESKTKFIAVTSGKGGVGKSTVSVNLAIALARLGKKVGIIDADIYGFSVPDMMGITERPKVINNIIYPVLAHGVQAISMGFFVHDNSPVIWRGPMLGKMLRNFFSEVHWDEVEYMILDLPPGTGDVALDVHSMLPQSKEIIVTTPHSTASFVATRAGAMAIKTNHEIIGVVENMSYYALPDGSKDYVFGQGGGQKVAEVLQTELLAQIPLGQASKEYTEEVWHSIYPEHSAVGQTYSQLAKKVLEKV